MPKRTEKQSEISMLKQLLTAQAKQHRRQQEHLDQLTEIVYRHLYNHTHDQVEAHAMTLWEILRDHHNRLII